MQKPLPTAVLVNLFSFSGAWSLIFWKMQKPLPTDQVILSNVILRPDRQLCSLPKRNGLWTRWKGAKHFILIFWCSTPFCALKKPQYLFSRLKIAPHAFNDAGLCFHGDLMNCNRYTSYLYYAMYQNVISCKGRSVLWYEIIQCCFWNPLIVNWLGKLQTVMKYNTVDLWPCDNFVKGGARPHTMTPCPWIVI